MLSPSRPMPVLHGLQIQPRGSDVPRMWSTRSLTPFLPQHSHASGIGPAFFLASLSCLPCADLHVWHLWSLHSALTPFCLKANSSIGFSSPQWVHILVHVCPACSDLSFGCNGDAQVVEFTSFDCTELKLELERFSVFWVTFVLEFIVNKS